MEEEERQPWKLEVFTAQLKLVRRKLKAKSVTVPIAVHASCLLLLEVRTLRGTFGSVDVWLGFCYVTPPPMTVDLNAVLLSQLNSLQTENTTLRWQAPSGPPQLQAPFSRHPPRGGRAISMYETGYSPKQYPHRAETGRHEDGVILQPFPTNVSTGRPAAGATSGLVGG